MTKLEELKKICDEACEDARAAYCRATYREAYTAYSVAYDEAYTAYADAHDNYMKERDRQEGNHE